MADAKAAEDAGAFAIVLECIPRAIAKKITDEVAIPTIGIGAGPDCDGQVLVLHDLLGHHHRLRAHIRQTLRRPENRNHPRRHRNTATKSAPANSPMTPTLSSDGLVASANRFLRKIPRRPPLFPLAV